MIFAAQMVSVPADSLIDATSVFLLGGLMGFLIGFAVSMVFRETIADDNRLSDLLKEIHKPERWEYRETKTTTTTTKPESKKKC